ncbi:hypothetical protein D3C74_418460 [compost metagenome]
MEAQPQLRVAEILRLPKSEHGDFVPVSRDILPRGHIAFGEGGKPVKVAFGNQMAHLFVQRHITVGFDDFRLRPAGDVRADAEPAQHGAVEAE